MIDINIDCMYNITSHGRITRFISTYCQDKVHYNEKANINNKITHNNDVTGTLLGYVTKL